MPRALALLALLRAASAVLVGDRVSYLAFGSNMHPAVLTRKRGVEPLRSMPAAAEGWRLGFSLRGGGREPSFASAEPDGRRTLYGVLFDAGALPGTVQQGDPVLPANGEVTDTSSLASRPVGVLTSLLEDGSTSAASFGLALVQPMQAPIGTRVSVNGATGEVVDVAYATRAGQQAGGTMAEEAPDDVPGDALAAAAAKKAAEAQRKAAKLKAMEAKMRELGLVKDDK